MRPSNRMRLRTAFLPIVLGAFLAMAMAGCGRSDEELAPAATPESMEPTATRPMDAPPPVATATQAAAPDLSLRPLVWFAPLPPMPTGPGRLFTGSDDFLELFTEPGAWAAARERVNVFKLYGEWVAYHATDEELRMAVEAIRGFGLALAVEAGPLDPPADCGQGIEGFAGTDEGRLIARRILQAGGRIDVLALDEPLFFASIYNGTGACGWPPDQVAEEVGKYIGVMRGLFPDVVVGDTEPLAGEARAADYTDWLETFRRVNGYDLAFLHIDVDWGRSAWPQAANAIGAFGREFGVPIGLIYTGNPQDADDETWLSMAGERVLRYEDWTAGTPEHVVFQSWHDKPDRLLPDAEPYTFTGFVRRYFEDREALGMRHEGAGANVAFGKVVRVSQVFEGQVGALAVDGDPGTAWNSGGFPLQWIQIDLGRTYDLREVRLTVAQSPAGETIHVLYVQGESTAWEFDQAHILKGATADSDVLVFAPGELLRAVRVLRIETTLTPSWVGWREIEVIAAE